MVTRPLPQEVGTGFWFLVERLAFSPKYHYGLDPGSMTWQLRSYLDDKNRRPFQEEKNW